METVVMYVQYKNVKNIYIFIIWYSLTLEILWSYSYEYVHRIYEYIVYNNIKMNMWFVDVLYTNYKLFFYMKSNLVQKNEFN